MAASGTVTFAPGETSETVSVTEPLARPTAWAKQTRNDCVGRTISTILRLELHDSQSYKYDIAFAGMDLPQLGGDVAPGAARRGWAVFEVPDTATGLVLRVQGDSTATGTTFSLG